MIGLLGSLLGGRGGRMLGGMIGGRTGAMIGGLVGSMVGGRRVAGAVRNAGGLGGLGGLFGGGGDDGGADQLADGPALTEADAEILIKAMANAAKSDGTVDQEEVDNILGQLDDASADERAFLQQELTSPLVDPAVFAAGVPEDLALEAYVVSATAVRVDTAAERTYLKSLGAALGISDEDQDALDRDLGVTG